MKTRYYLDEEEAISFGERMKDVIKAKGKTQRSLSKDIGCRDKAIYRICNGAPGGVDGEMLERISKALETRLDYLLTGKEENDGNEPVEGLERRSCD